MNLFGHALIYMHIHAVHTYMHVTRKYIRHLRDATFVLERKSRQRRQYSGLTASRRANKSLCYHEILNHYA
jgi:hypothetical protein